MLHWCRMDETVLIRLNKNLRDRVKNLAVSEGRKMQWMLDHIVAQYFIDYAPTHVDKSEVVPVKKVDVPGTFVIDPAMGRVNRVERGNIEKAGEYNVTGEYNLTLPVVVTDKGVIDKLKQGKTVTTADMKPADLAGMAAAGRKRNDFGAANQIAQLDSAPITPRNRDMEFCKHNAVKGLCKKGCK